MKEIDDEILGRFAKALDIPLEQLKNTEESVPMMYIENNTVETTNGSGSVNFGNDNNNNNSNTYNPIEKITELYERLLQSEKEKLELVEKKLSSLEEKFKGK